MKHIITLTLNPAIDMHVAVNRIIAEKKLTTTLPISYPGGGGINISRALHRLGYGSCPVFFTGGYTGEVFKKLLLSEGISGHPVQIKTEMRQNIIIEESDTGHQYRFGLPGPTVSVEEVDRLLDVIKSATCLDFLIISGSLCNGIDPAFFQTLKKVAHQKAAKLIVDLPAPALQAAFDVGVYLAKPSLSELAELTGNSYLSKAQAIEAAKNIIASEKCEVIVLSMGSKGAVMVTADRVLAAKVPAGKVRGTVGAGDCLLAGVVYALARGLDFSAALVLGAACGTASTTNPGTGMFTKEDVELIKPRVILSE